LARQILGISATTPIPLAEAFQTAIHLREAIYQVFTAVARSREPKRKDVKLIEELASLAMTHRHLAAAGSEYRWEWKRDNGGLTWYVLWPIAASAADLLTSERAAQVRECGAKTCAWLFLDESRNHSRRWCDMRVCGNRQKARRHYDRQR
jgi:predicted RNA-binding Zn ribbon-like protein